MVKILSLDGGGLRGIYSLEILEKIEKDYNIKCCDYFDIIIGTSTGSIIATLLALGKSPEEIKKAYLDSYKEIFYTDEISLRQKGIFYSIYRNKSLIDSAKKNFGAYNYEDLKTKLIIPTTNLSNASIEIIKSYEQINKEEKDRIKIYEAIVSSSSAPAYFEPNIVDDTMYVDGGVYANNPALIAFAESFKFGAKRLKDIKIISIGTGKRKVDYKKEELANIDFSKFIQLPPIMESTIKKVLNIKENGFGLLNLASPLMRASIDTSIELSEYVLSNSLSNKNYVRLNDVDNSIKLDEIPYNLIEKLEIRYKEEYKKQLDEFFEKENDNKSMIDKLLWNIYKKLDNKFNR